MRRWTGFRVWAVVWAVLQLALPAVATFADALLERESEAYGITHVESSSTASCRPSHPAECPLCQFVARSAAPSHGTPRAIPASIVSLPPAAATIAGVGSALSQLPPARAPPMA
jgi:hypothetical protein